ncbi:uncharacterized protein VTP21DRAFT_4487 [Calcarisporiella thermophila]|uniref:uncharacterized protein n=1 Tax=Calcarisporiella thermophila TaxID=911321 RepID=UPI00374485A8
MSKNDLENWAVDRLSIFLGLDTETLTSQVMPYVMRISGPEQTVEHLQELLGTTPDAALFIQEFVERRFPPQNISKNTTPATTARSPLLNEGAFTNNSKMWDIDAQTPKAPAWANEKNVYRKKEQEEVYFVGGKKSRPKEKESVSESSPELPHPAPTTNLPSIKPEEGVKKNKKTGKSSLVNADLEKALRELDLASDSGGGAGRRRKACNCMATKHPLLTVAPNCLSCGKIICTHEGPGPCTFCGTPILSREQQLNLLAELKRERQLAKMEQHNQARKKNRTGPAGTVPYAAKVSGEGLLGGYSSNSGGEGDDEEAARLNAELHKEKLLEYQRTSAQRSKIIDQATEFTLPSDTPNRWLSPQEKALELKKAQKNQLKLNAPRRRVMTLDMANRRVTMQEAPVESDEEEDEEIYEDGGKDKLARENQTNRNPLLKKPVENLRFISSGALNTISPVHAQSVSKPPRVQDGEETEVYGLA